MKAGPAEHLAFEHLDPVDGAFDDPGAPGQGEAGDDCIAVTVDACGEGMEAGEVISPDGIEPLRQPFALALVEYLPEGRTWPVRTPVQGSGPEQPSAEDAPTR